VAVSDVVEEHRDRFGAGQGMARIDEIEGVAGPR
jgi:hypothetical protein